MRIIKQFVVILLLSFALFVSGSDKLQHEEEFVESVQLAAPTTQTAEYEEIKSFSILLNFVDIICQEALKQEDKETFALNWMEGLLDLVQGIYKRNSYQEVQSDENGRFAAAVNNFDSETLMPEHDFDRETFMSTGQILFSDDSTSETSSASDDDDEFRTDTFPALLMNYLIKAKMIKGNDEEDTEGTEEYSDDFELDSGKKPFGVTIPPVRNGHESDEEKYDLNSDFEHNDGSENSLSCISVEKKRRGGRGRIGGGIETSMLNMAVGAASSESGIGIGQMIGGMAVSSGLNIATGASEAPNSGAQGAAFDQSVLMEQLQQQIMSQLMEQLAQKNPQLAQFSSLLQDERGKLTAALGTDADGLPQLSREGVIEFLKTSALPKLLNSAIKGKTGVDVLKSLAMALRVINEGLGILEVVLKLLLRATRTVRYYTLCTSSIVADMAREDNMKSIVDLSVSVDTLPDVVAKKSMMGGINKMFRKSLRKSAADGEEDSSSSMSPFNLGMQAALSKARDFTTQFQQLPPALLLTIIHTIFAELDKRKGIVRSSLAGKQHKTLIKLQDRVNKAVENIYRAIIHNTPEAADHLSHVPAHIFTDILLSLISPVKLEPARLDHHLAAVTEWIRPLMSILDQDAQSNILNFLLTDPEAEQVFTKSNRKSLKSPAKTFNWSPKAKLSGKK